MAPTSPTYDRLEAGRPSSPKLKSAKRFGWKRFALGAGLLLALQQGISLPKWGSKWDPVNTPYEGKPGTDKGEDWGLLRLIRNRRQSTPYEGSQGQGQAHLLSPLMYPCLDASVPASFKTDPDPSSTPHCTKPHSPSSPLVQYALMLDAGSTGSRIHIYKFNNCGPQPSYEWEVFRQTEPRPGGGGLSAYASNPKEAAASLTVLLDEAMRVVPKDLRKCTPVAVKATAGLRRLPGSQATDILAAVKELLRSGYPFAISEKEGEEAAVSIMGGADEGVFAWVTANYLLGALSPSSSSKPTYAVLDLGGGSTQIVFAPAANAEAPPLLEGEHKYDLEFAGSTRALYQHSYLGYGLMSARESVHRVVEFMAGLHSSPSSSASEKTIGNPCLARGMQRVVELSSSFDGQAKNVTMDGADVGGYDACRRVVELVLAKDSVCTVRPCSFGGVYQPALKEVFPVAAGRVLLLSYFYDRVAPLVDPAPEAHKGGVKEETTEVTATVDAIADLARVVCGGRDAWLPRWGAHTALMKELEGRPEWCLDLTFMHGLLRTGYEFDGDREVLFGKKIAGTELGWCLGAGIKLVGGVDVQCRV
ncbi:nucleoside phosphatase family-domain-containing protein [Mycena olivaceomarginata]|nr:nucleoside phosphatase family-domain-containing protein [Mycena olivaceomarginata]